MIGPADESSRRGGDTPVAHAQGTLAVSIRDADADDTARIVPLVVEMERHFTHRTPVDEASVARFLAQPQAGILLAERHGCVVGLLSWSITLDLYHAAPAGEIEDVVVKEDARGSGIGEALVRAALERFLAAGCAEASVITAPHNDTAQHVYRTAGLTEELLCLQRHFVRDG